MSASRKAAPARQVVSVAKSGTYGNVEYRVVLACDHVVLSKRRPPADTVRCLACLNGDEPRPIPSVPTDPVTAMLALESRTRDALSSRLGVPPDSIVVTFDPWSDEPRISHVTVTLDGETVRGLVR